MNTTITNLNGDAERVTLPVAHWSGRERAGTGVWITGLYHGPRSGRVFIRTHSIWDDGRHMGINVGERVCEVECSEFLLACERTGATVPEQLEATATRID